MDVFLALEPADRRALPARYLEELRARDGEPDLRAHEFTNREPSFEALAERPVRWQGPAPVDQALFDRFLPRGCADDPAASARALGALDRATLWALCTAKVNRAERFGVAYGVERHGFTAVSERDPFAYIEIEEIYHTRILCEALAVLGIRMELPPPGPVTLDPGEALRPPGFSELLVLCGELVGLSVFRLLVDEARRLFGEEASPLARLEALFAQILVDEGGHVLFLRSRLDQPELGLSRRALPAVAAALLTDLPELSLLFGRARITAALARLVTA